MRRSQRFVPRWEIGERRVDVIEFQDFCRVYKLPASYFVGRWPSE